MTWNVVYDNVVGTELVNYDWKPNHEYYVFNIAAAGPREIDACRLLTLDGTLSPANKGYAQATVDGWVVFVQSPTKQIRSLPRSGVRCPIVKIIERPIVLGSVHATDNDNWEQFWTGSIGTSVVNVPWEYGYEYVIFCRKQFNLGNITGNPTWIAMGQAFAADTMLGANLGVGETREGISFHPKVFDGFLQMYRNSTTGLPYRMQMEQTSGICFIIFRRPIRILTEADNSYNGWKVIRTALPSGVTIGRSTSDIKPLAWPDGKDVIVNHTDPSGTNEMSTAQFFTDADMLNSPSLKSQWNWTILAQESGSSCRAALTPPSYANKGWKGVYAFGKSYPRLLQAYEKLDRVAPPIPLPPPDPPPIETCEDRCYLAGSVWQQNATMEVRFVNPPDWQSRQYEFEWGGDLGNGQIELVEVLEGGRVAKIRLAKELEITDADGQITFDVTCLVSDVQYANLGVTDIAEAQITFELPCVFEGNDPDISIEDLTILEQDANHIIGVRVTLSEPYIGDQLCVDWTTVDGTATSDLAVRALARDTGGLPFITIIESAVNTTRVYIDGAFPKWYNNAHNNIVAGGLNEKTLIFSRNLLEWLRGTRTTGRVLLLGDTTSGNYNVKDTLAQNGTGFRDYWTTATSDLSKTMDVLHIVELAAEPSVETFIDQYECIIFFSSTHTSGQVVPNNVLIALDTKVREGLGIAVITDHGTPDGVTGFFRAANDFLEYSFNTRVVGSIDRQDMILNVEDFVPHPLWTGLSGRFPSNGSEAYIDAVDSVPDYIANSGQICFASGEDEKIIDIEIIGDTVEEDQFEQFSIVMSNNNRGVLVKPIGIITIEDDDAEPCGVATPSGGDGITETSHALGPDAGVINVNYQMFSQPDMMEIFYDGNLVATTGGLVSGTGTLSFYYPGPPNPSTCQIRMTGSGSGTLWNYTLSCPVPVPEVDAFIYATSMEANAKMGTFTPPTPQDVFNSWDRFNGTQYFVGGAGATGDAAAWELLNNPTRVSQPNNTGSLTGFVSPLQYSNYIFEAVLTSNNADDDLIGLLVGADNSGGVVRTLSFARTGGGVNGPTSPGSAWNWGVYIREGNTVIGSLPFALIGANGGWADRKTKVRIERNGNIITAQCTNFYTTANAPAFAPASLIEIDLDSDARYAPFRNQSAYGYVSFSQTNSTYLDTFFTGGINQNKVYDVELNRTYEYNFGTFAWENINRTIQQDLGAPIFADNPETNQRFFVDNGGIVSV